MAALLAVDKLVRRVSMRIVELAERGAHAASGSLLLGRPAEENEACLLQGLRNLGGVDDVVERCTQVHDGDVRGVLLWEWSVLLLQRKAFERRARGARWVAALLVSQGHHFDHGSKVKAFTATRASVAERIEDISYLLRERLGNVEAVAADVEEGAAVTETVPEAGQVVADAVEGAKPLDEAGGDPLAGDRRGSRPELDSGRRHALPHGGRQLSWEFRDSSHGDGLTEGLDGGDDGSGSGLCQRRHLGYPGSGPSTPEVKPLLPACFLLSSQWLQRSSSCSSRGGRRS
jgi:hypothetical protein